MKFKKYLVILLSLLYFDLIFNLFAYDNYLRESFINIVLFCLVNSVLIFLLTSVWNNKVNKVITYVIYIFMGFWYSLYYIFYKVLLTPFSIALFRQTYQVLDFAENVIISIGTTPNPLITKTTKGIENDARGCIMVKDGTLETSREGIFAGGDIVTGAATVILAMKAGKNAAKEIDEYIKKF